MTASSPTLAGTMTDMTRPPEGPPVWPSHRLDLLAFLPMIQMVWSDGVLTPDELLVLCEGLEDQEWLDTEGREILRSWLRPDSPPTPTAVVELREIVRSWWPEDRRVPDSLAGLGLELIRGAGLTAGPWSEDRAPEALARAEERLGIPGPEAVRELLGVSGPPRSERHRHTRFWIESLGWYLNDTHVDIRTRVLELMKSPELALPAGLPRGEYRERVLQALQVLAREGLGSLEYPAAYGGRDDPGAAITVFETLAYGDLSVLVKFGVQFGLWGGSILQLGTAHHHEAYLARIGSLELPGCYGMTETGHGSNVRDLETVARYDADAGEFVVHTPSPDAKKDWIGNAALHGRMATVFAQLEVGGTPHGVHAFVVPIRDGDGQPLPGVTITDRDDKVGLNGVDNGTLSFHDVRIPRGNLLNRFGEVTPEGVYSSPIPSSGRRFFTMLGTLVAGRVSVAAASVSAAKTALTVAIRYGDRRRQFGPFGSEEAPILDYRVHQRLLLPRLATTYGLHFAVRDLIRRYTTGGEVTKAAEGSESEGRPDGGTPDRAVEVDAAGLKAYASASAVATIQACREACGGQGYLAANRLGVLRNDVDAFTTFEGANPVLLQLVAKGLLSGYGDELGDLRLWGMLRHVAERAGVRLTEMNPVVTRRTDEDHLRDPEFHVAAFRYREDRLLTSAARRLRDLLEDGVHSFDAMNRTQDHLVTLAHSHVERLVLERFRHAVVRAPTPGLSEALDGLATLYALATMETNRAWYLESGYMEPAKTRAIRWLVNELCSEIREQAVFLVDGFAIPDEVLRAPIAPESGDSTRV